jgi:hypothetical protein
MEAMTKKRKNCKKGKDSEAVAKNSSVKRTDHPDGTIEEFFEVDGKRSVKRTAPDGTIEEFFVVDGKRSGPSKITGPDGIVVEFESCNEHGPSGRSKRTFPNGAIEEFRIIDGQRCGSKITCPDGTTIGDFNALKLLRMTMGAAAVTESLKECLTVHEIVELCVLWLKSSKLNTFQCEHPDQLYPEYPAGSYVSWIEEMKKEEEGSGDDVVYSQDDTCCDRTPCVCGCECDIEFVY